MGWVVGLALMGAKEMGPQPSLTALGPQLRPHVTFSRPMTAPLTILSPGNALPPPAAVGHSVSHREGPGQGPSALCFHAPCLSSMPDLKTSRTGQPLQVLLLPGVCILGSGGGGWVWGLQSQ